jgi:hypothetical protein
MGLDMAEIVMEVEDRFSITLSENGFAGTYGQLVEQVTEAISRNAPQLSNQEIVVDKFLRELLTTQYFVKPELIKHSAKLFAGGLELG